MPSLTSFVGRAGEVEKVAGLLGEYRLVTVTGPGGVGKTRLAAEVARLAASRFADGACLVELAAVHDPALVPAAVATALGTQQAPGMSVTGSLAGALARQQLLLVLDNCEHVLGAVAELCGSLLPAADDVTVLATSREPVGAAGEARYRLRPLAVPVVSQEAKGSESVALFADRARQVDPDFDPTGEAGLLVASLVARLDGMPLAIELAAARVEALGLPQLLERLDEGFSLLTGGDRMAAARQRSLTATVDWSYQLLSEQQRRVFRRLAAFPGPFTLDGASAVAGTGAAPAALHLVDCSLLTPPRIGPDGKARYVMLETLRAFGLDRLADTGEYSDTATALARYALAVAEHAAAALQAGGGEAAAARCLDAEEAVVHQALVWNLEHDPSSALRLAVALAPWWRLRGRMTDGRRLLSACAGKIPSGGDMWCAAQYWLGRAAVSVGDIRAALDHFTAVRDDSAGREASALLADALGGRAIMLMSLDRIPEGVQDAHSALALARGVGHRAGEALALAALSTAALYVADTENALKCARQACLIDPASIPGDIGRVCCLYLSLALMEVGELPAARRNCAEGLGRAREAGDLQAEADSLFLLADLDTRTGQIPEAGAHLRDALELGRRIGARSLLVDCVDYCGHLCAATGRWAEAVTAWAAFAAWRHVYGAVGPPQDAHRSLAIRHAAQALGPALTRDAEERGAAMTLEIAAAFAAMLSEADARAAPAPDTSPALEQLSGRERELVTLVAQGRTDTQIAAQLYISVSTVRSHLDRIRDKSGCRRRADLTRLALRAGLV